MTDADRHLPPESDVGRVALRVGDLDRQVDFYEGLLGLSICRRTESEVVLGTNDDPIVVLTARPDLPPRTRAETGLFHAAIRLPSRGALGDVLERVEADWQLTGASDHLVSEALYLDDPEGNGIELYWDRPKSQWPTTEDGQVAMDTRPLDLHELRDAADGSESVPIGTTLGHVHLEVSGLEATRRFYTKGLGMRVRQTYGTDAIFLAAGEYHHHVGANRWNGRTERASGRGLDWFEVRVPERRDLAEIRSRCEESDADPAEIDGELVLEDPDGIEIHVRSRGT